MRPGQFHPNGLEVAILERLARDKPRLHGPIATLRVFSRKYTRVGCRVTFQCEESEGPDVPFQQVYLDMPGVSLGLVAALQCRGTSPEYLELCTHGNDRWDGTFEGFSFIGQDA